MKSFGLDPNITQTPCFSRALARIPLKRGLIFPRLYSSGVDMLFSDHGMLSSELTRFISDGFAESLNGVFFEKPGVVKSSWYLQIWPRLWNGARQAQSPRTGYFISYHIYM